MLSRRFFAAFLISTLVASSASAQFVHTSVTTHPRAVQHPLNAPPTIQSDSLSFSVVQIDTNYIQTNSNGQLTLVSTVRNLAQSSDSIYFARTQQLPCGWSTSICWGTSCYANTTDSIAIPVRSDSIADLSLDVYPLLDDVPDSATIWLRVGVVGKPADTLLLPFHVSYVPPNPPIVFQWSSLKGDPVFDSTFKGPGPHTFYNFLTNGLCHGANYKFNIQDSLPVGWTLTTSVGSSTIPSSDSLKVNFDAYGSIEGQQEVNFKLNVPTLTAPDSAIVFLGVHPVTTNAADSAVYRFSIAVQPQSGVANAPDDRAGLVVTNAWPNPLHPSSELHLEVLTDEQGLATARVYDLDGTLQATLDLGQLSVGSNELQAALPDLPSGEYIVRVAQGTSASEVVRINYIK